jgi:hypothetical protein
MKRTWDWGVDNAICTQSIDPHLSYELPFEGSRTTTGMDLVCIMVTRTWQ